MKTIHSYLLLITAFVIGLLVPAASAQTCAPPPSGMVAWWPADGNANDIQGGNDGTLQNGATFTPGKVEQAFRFNGTNQFVVTSNAPELNFQRTDAFSIDAWIRTTETSLNTFIASKRQLNAPFRGYAMMISNGQAPRCEDMNPVPTGAGALVLFVDGSVTADCPRDHAIIVTGTTPLNDGQWHHVTGTYDGSSSASGIRLYVDGVLETTTTQSDNLGTNSITNNAAFVIGAGSGNGPQPFNGDIDEVEVFNRVLSDSEIQDIVNAGSAGKCRTCTPPPSGMNAWYPGDGNANDIVGGNNGALDGATFAPGKVDQAFSFDGVDDRVVIPHKANQNSGRITIDAWINQISSGHGRTIAQKRTSANVGGYTFETTHSPSGPDNGLQFVIWVSGAPQFLITPANVITNGIWQHVAATYNGTTMRIYIDGVEVSNLGVSGAIDASTEPIIVGRNVAGPPVFHGRIDELEFFGRALSGSEVASIANAGSAGKCRPALQLTAAVSRKTHGSAGVFAINLPLTGAPGVECRSSAGNHRLVFTFTNNVISGSASVTTGIGSVSGSPTFAGMKMTVNLTGVADVQKITVTLSNVTDSFAQVMPDQGVSVNMLIGDTTGNKVVNSSDIGQTKSKSGQITNSTNFRNDVTVSGSINASDIGLVKSKSGHAVP